MIRKGGARLLALAGVTAALVGAAASLQPAPPAPAVLAHAAGAPIQPVHPVRPAVEHAVARPRPAAAAPRRQPQPESLPQLVKLSKPRATISLYEHTVRQSTLRTQGCTAAKRGVGGIVILDFGQPAYNGHTYGTYLFSGRFAGNAAITRAMLGYAVGYRRCLPKGSELSISLARGTSNYHPQVPSAYQAGRRWARETHALERLLVKHRLASHVTSAAADDVEPAWDRSFHRTRDFFRGYRHAGAGHVLYNFGSLDGGVGSIWNAKQIFYVASGMKYVAAIPEIYNSAMAKQWAELAHIAKHRYHRPLKFAGVMTQRTSRNKATKPRDAHQMLVRALASVGPGVADVPPALTNIRSAE